MHFNCNGLASKVDEIEAALYDINPDIVCFSETHAIKDQNITIKNFHTSFHFTREMKRGGGSSIYVKSHIQATERQDLIIYAAADVLLADESITCVNIYRAPPKGTVALHEFLDRFEELSSRLGSRKVLITGDFNVDLKKDDSARSLFSDLVSGSGWVFCNTAPTREGAVLDNIITRAEDFQAVGSVCTTHELGISDHDAVSLTLPMNTPKEPLTPRRTIIRLDEEAFFHELAARNKEPIFRTYDVDSKCSQIIGLIQEATRIHSTQSIKPPIPEKGWLNQEIINSSKIKKKLLSQSRLFPDDTNIQARFKEAKQAHRRLVRNTKTSWKRQKLLKCNGNSKHIWKLVNYERGKLPQNSGPSRINSDNNLINDPKAISLAFANHFDSICKK